MEPLFFKPIPFKTVWGGTSIKEYYGYDWMPDGTGQAWAFSAQADNSTECVSGPFAGKTLKELWENNPELFGNTNREFPLIVSLLCPCDDLSIQVHPNEEQARELGYTMGKNEAWYFLDASDDAQIVFGHNATNEANLRSYIDEGRWSELHRHLKVRTDDFVYVPAGQLHACGKNVIAYEVQQATNVTFRFYDYDRTDDEGNKRELHLEQAINCLTYDSDLNYGRYTTSVVAYGGCVRTLLCNNDSFTIEKLQIDEDSYHFEEETYELVSVVRGEGTVNEIPVSTGSHFLVPKDTPVDIKGSLTCMLATA